MKKIAVIGGGPAGCCAAIECARALTDVRTDCEITIYEALGEVCKKILATGNGRCNILNMGASPDDYNGDRAFAGAVLEKYPVQSNIYFLNSIGIVTCAEDMGRVYPLSGQAAAVKNAIENEINNLNIKTAVETKISALRKDGGTFILNGEFKADAVIIAGGGKSAPVHGSDGSCIELLGKLSHKIITPLPALVPIYIEKPDKTLKGVRAKGRIEILSGNAVKARSDGELQFTDYGISGIPAMDVSGRAARLLESGEVTARIKLIPQMSENDIISFLLSRRSAAGGTDILTCLCGIMNRSLARAKLKYLKIDCAKAIESLDYKTIRQISQIIKSQDFKVKSVGAFYQSQVTSGGAATCEFGGDLQSKKQDGLFAAGEVLDIDAKCGGYNLGWCISSGRLAGKKAAEYIIGISEK